MAIIPIFKAKKTCGLPHFLDMEAVEGWVKTMPEEFDVLIRKPNSRSDRSTQQNSYYWGVIVDLISGETGYTPDETHDLIKSTFLKNKKVLVVNNKPTEVVSIKSTTDLSTKQMEEFLSFVRMWASQELGLFLPLPNEAEGE